MMVSGLENILLRLRDYKDEDGNWQSGFRTKLFEYLIEDGISLIRLRATSRAMCNIVGHLEIGRVFRQVYIRAPPPDPHDILLFEPIAQHCSSLIITIGDRDVNHVRRRSRPRSQVARRSQEVVRALFDRLDLLSLSDASSPRDSRNSTGSIRQSVASMISGASTPRSPISPLSFEDEQLQDEAIEQWLAVLSKFEKLASLTLRIHGDTGWPGRTEIENTVVHVRNAIERANLPQLTTLNVVPVHAMGIIHLNWAGLNAFGSSFASSAAVWQRIETLDLRIRYPAGLSNSRRLMFMNSLYTYLNSFSSTLRCLRLVWLGAEGPSPLALFHEPGLNPEPIYFYNLEELWLGNITHPHRTIRLIPDFTPNVILAKNLRSRRRDSLSVSAEDSSAWMEIMLAQTTMVQHPFADRTSSIYSIQSARSSYNSQGSVSRSSGVVPIMLDIDR